MTRLPDISNQKINKYAGAMEALAKGVDVMEKLKPCPFCGGKAKAANLGSPMVVCMNGCCHVAHDNPIEFWNTRPIEDALHAQLAARDALIERLMEAGNDMTADCEASWYALHIPVCTPVVNWHALVDKYSVSKDGGEK